MRRFASCTALAFALTIPVLGLTSGAAHSDKPGDDNDGKVCLPLNSGKIDTKGSPQTVTIKAPKGELIFGYCVKAGSIKQGNGPEYVKLEKPLQTLVIRHSSGKAVSHYSYALMSSTPPPVEPSDPPSDLPSDSPSDLPSDPPTDLPSDPPTDLPSDSPSDLPSDSPSDLPSDPPADLPPVVNPPTSNSGEFDWNWKYATPACDALTVAYPSDIPAGQANDVNIRLSSNQGEFTLNYHNNETTWSGTHGFTYSQHALWPEGVTDYAVVWVQVGGSNYHFGESFHNAPIESPVKCRIKSDNNAETYDVPVGVSNVSGLRSSAVVAKGRAPAPAVVSVDQPGVAPLALQKLIGNAWATVKTVTVVDGSAKVTFPKQSRKGTFKYRLVLPGSESVTGDTTAPLKVRVR